MRRTYPHPPLIDPDPKGVVAYGIDCDVSTGWSVADGAARSRLALYATCPLSRA